MNEKNAAALSIMDKSKGKGESFLVYFLDLDGEAGVLLLDGVTDALVPAPELLVFVAKHVIAILDRPLDLLLARLRELELHDGVVLELGLADEVEAPLGLREDGEGSEVLVGGGEAAQVFDDEVRVLAELDEEVLVGLDALEVPVVALEYEVEVDLGVAGQLHLDVFGELVLVLHHQLHSQLLGLLQRLHHLRLLLDPNHEAVLAAVNHLAALRHRRVPHRTALHAQQLHK